MENKELVRLTLPLEEALAAHTAVVTQKEHLDKIRQKLAAELREMEEITIICKQIRYLHRVEKALDAVIREVVS